MPDYTPFLLYTDRQIQEFRTRYATFIGQRAQTYADWINGLPVMERIDYLKSVPERNIGPVIGLLCILINEHKISITFINGANLFYRNPSSLEEWETWCESRSPKRRKKEGG